MAIEEYIEDDGVLERKRYRCTENETSPGFIKWMEAHHATKIAIREERLQELFGPMWEWVYTKARERSLEDSEKSDVRVAVHGKLLPKEFRRQYGDCHLPYERGSQNYYFALQAKGCCENLLLMVEALSKENSTEAVVLAFNAGRHFENCVVRDRSKALRCGNQSLAGARRGGQTRREERDEADSTYTKDMYVAYLECKAARPSWSTAQVLAAIARRFTHGHGGEQRAFKPESIRRRLKRAGYNLSV